MRIVQIHKRTERWGLKLTVRPILLIFLFSSGAISAAQAQIVDPFSKAPESEWVPLDKYQPAAPAAEASAAPVSSSAVKAPPVSAPPVAAKAPSVRPARDVRLPAVPDPASSPEVTVSSTDQLDEENTPENKPWVNVQEFKQEEQKQEEVAENLKNKDKPAFSIRLPSLPGTQIQSISAARVSQGKLEREAKAERAALANKQTASAKELQIKQRTDACQALADFRRRQLQAIESDRDTLAQLKAVLSDLGLVTKLSFMTNADDSLSPAAKEQAGPTAQVHEDKSAVEIKIP